eukprot:TRINITY_DN2737_c0_g1_i3.p1 TRINITY_DN2737_c0_g1~~TRINITY_DN2737_c0_g1_i3.p1  ORF type:complete len:474 (+),score=94.15 TRINITY_DN2737_c0_g1_i3:99-1520(+)
MCIRDSSRTNQIFAWYQPCRGSCDPATAPLLIWLQGGPGGPGSFGAFGEIGNWYIGGAQSDSKPHKRCFSWCITNNCLFVDQPVQTGFSFQTESSTGKPVTDIHSVDYTGSSENAMRQVLNVLTQFYTVFSEVSKAPLVITGESYGGLYTPHLGALIMEHNSKASDEDKINFKGLAVGDPAIDWEAQMPTYANTLYGMGVLMLDEREQLAKTMQASVALLKTGDCPRAFDVWNSVWDDNGGLGPSEGHGWYANTTGSFNTANVLMGNSPIGWTHINQFFATSEAAQAFHVADLPSPTNGTAAEVGVKIYNAFVNSGDWCANSSFLYSRLLREADIDLMIYSSTVDPLLGPPTSEAAVQSILRDAAAHGATGLQTAFNTKKKVIWFVDSTTDMQPAGYAKCVPNGNNRFCYTVIRNAGHESPGYQPRASFDMINRFLDKREWDSSGDRTTPSCSECSGAGPFAGAALPSCHTEL